MTGNKLLKVSKVISKVIGMILVIAGGIELFIGVIFALFMGPIEIPQVDNVMVIFVALIYYFVQFIPYFLITFGAIGAIFGVINLIISAVLGNYVELDILEKKKKTYRLIISSIFYGILVIPSIFLTIYAIVDAEDFFTAIFISAWLFIINLPNIVMFSFLLISRNIIKNYKVEEVLKKEI